MFAKFMEGRHRGHGDRLRRHGGERDERTEFAGRHRGGRHAAMGEERGEGRGERRSRRGGGRGERMQRLFEHGDLRLVLLAMVAKKPSHGYELIKAIEEASSGLYVPSPGVIYPTLTLLEEQDFLEPLVSDNGRKSYRLTAAGQEELSAHQAVVDAIFARLARREKHREHGSNLAEGIADSMNRLRSVLRGNVMRDDLSPEQVERVNATLLKAAEIIEAEFAAIDAELKA
ncbi:PadR family transcriptional regulator [Rouxiella badensis]|uniref:PadR family transcriptional regulator n=1 Tax=Rouxiella badensis TaxID=1646377 RepID=UPI003C4E18A2